MEGAGFSPGVGPSFLSFQILCIHPPPKTGAMQTVPSLSRIHLLHLFTSNGVTLSLYPDPIRSGVFVWPISATVEFTPSTYVFVKFLNSGINIFTWNPTLSVICCKCTPGTAFYCTPRQWKGLLYGCVVFRDGEWYRVARTNRELNSAAVYLQDTSPQLSTHQAPFIPWWVYALTQR